eukprot:TRINITY_DN33979_c0_g1_i1.p1 TRINITY_DN33979_c0_g1~~TRINITY_DN33979_c0_g1_i1.p1  ORF type:complete len:756 (+),score=82.78 TRINITY_DN33979_c0_g1_i1:298-2268(+)
MVRGRKCVEVGATNDFPAMAVTVAEAMLGLSAMILQLFGSVNVHLEVMDDGSGKLLQYYSSLGFKHIGFSRRKIHEILEVSVGSITRLAPQHWFQALLPQEFDARSWLQSSVSSLWIERARNGTLPCWEWMLRSPTFASVRFELIRASADNAERWGSPGGICFVLNASISNAKGEELVSSRSLAVIERRLLSVLWLGRSSARAVHGSVKGVPMYSTELADDGGSDAKEESSTCGRVTSAIALLGASAAVAGWFGIHNVELKALDTGSGRLMQYLKRLGFCKRSSAHHVDKHGRVSQPWLRAHCDELMRRCCPQEWKSRFVSEEDRNRFCTPKYVYTDIALPDYSEDVAQAMTTSDKQDSGGEQKREGGRAPCLAEGTLEGSVELGEEGKVFSRKVCAEAREAPAKTTSRSDLKRVPRTCSIAEAWSAPSQLQRSSVPSKSHSAILASVDHTSNRRPFVGSEIVGKASSEQAARERTRAKPCVASCSDAELPPQGPELRPKIAGSSSAPLLRPIAQARNSSSAAGRLRELRKGARGWESLRSPCAHARQEPPLAPIQVPATCTASSSDPTGVNEVSLARATSLVVAQASATDAVEGCAEPKSKSETNAADARTDAERHTRAAHSRARPPAKADLVAMEVSAPLRELLRRRRAELEAD